MSGRNLTLSAKTINCISCSQPFQQFKKQKVTCSQKCYLREKVKTTKKTGGEGVDYIVCEVCGQQGKDLGTHYKKVHPTHNPAKTKCQSIIDNVKGEKNPAYQHGGKFSPFSKNFVHYEDEEKRKNTIKKARSSVKQSGSNPFDRNYYETDEQYKKAQTRDLSWFIKKYGNEEGKKRHAAKTEKWLETLNLKSDEEKRRINRMKLYRSGAISKAEKELLKAISDNKIHVNDQFQLEKEGKGYYMYDINVGNRIVEYNGDYWHANPAKYSPDDYLKSVKLTAKEIWEKDKQKIDFARRRGYEVLVVWEADYKKDKQGTIEKCLNFLTQ